MVTIYRATHILHSQMNSSDVNKMAEAANPYLVHNKVILPKRARLRLNSLHMKGNLICCVKPTIHWGPILRTAIHEGIPGWIEQTSADALTGEKVLHNCSIRS